MLHAHISQSSRDCDGDYTSGWITQPTHEEASSTFGELDFKHRVLSTVVRLSTVAELRISPLGLEWYEDTEEGYSRTSVTWCEDDCELTKPWHRDHRAEEAGY